MALPTSVARRGGAALVAAVAVLAVSGFAAASSSAAGAGTRSDARLAARGGPGAKSATAVDVRKGTTSGAQVAALSNGATASTRPATRALGRQLGIQSVVDMDSVTGTPRMLARLDGFLTGPSAQPASAVALDYVRAHLGALGLTNADLSTLRLRDAYVDVAGIQHLSWTQWRDGIEVFGNGLQASVTKTGRLLSLGGSPVSGLQAPAAGPVSIGDGAAAIAVARKSQGEAVSAGPNDRAERVLFVTSAGTHLAWRTITMSAAHPAVTVVDAHSGKVLFRQSLENDENAAADAVTTDSTGIAYRYYPGAAVGGAQQGIDYTAQGWLGPKAKILSGNNTHTFSDVNDDNVAQKTEEVGPRTDQKWNYALRPFHVANVSFCDNPWPCSWNPDKPFSWKVNRAQNAAQVFFYVNQWHDHLQAAPIGFTEAAGNFQKQNFTAEGKGGDPVLSQTDDGANSDNGLPDGNHVDNANMDTPPDGQSPTMQMYLQHQPGTSYPDGDPFSPTNVGDEADTVYHEYTHGLSNRLVVDADGVSTLGNFEAGAMGEAWSDWYAMDYLVAHGLQQDVPNKVDVVLFQYDGAGVALDRTEPIDCKLNSGAARCPGGSTDHTGGYTYADYGHVIGFPEVHSDGEIWAQTLWDLRDALGSKKSESLVTRAMSLSPANPSFLDERNAILLADQGVYNGQDRSTIWHVFAHRGMGYYAGAVSGDDTTPGADFHVPPTQPHYGFVSGRVVDSITGKPVAGATVTLAFEGTPGLDNFAATTSTTGRYKIGPAPTGTYPKLLVEDAGYVPIQVPVTVTEAGTTRNFTLERDWAAVSGGARITAFNGPDGSGFGCGPEQAIDADQSSAWETSTGDNAYDPTNHFVPKHFTVKLSATVDVSSFGVDPSAGCQDGGSASTAGYKIETSPDGSTWTTAATGTFTADDRGRINNVAPAAGATGVRYVRFTILSNQTPDFATNCPGGAFSGCTFTDLAELEVFGT